MFSAGHLIWIVISFLLILLGYGAICARKLPLDRLLKICLGIGLISEAAKVLCVMQILPMVEPRVVNGTELAYAPAGQYTPYLEMAHLPFELCSLMTVFIAAALLMKDGRRREQLLTLMYVTGTVGGVLGILLAYITADYESVRDYFASPRVWQYFTYHSMITALGLYLGLRRPVRFSFRTLRNTLLGLMALDLPTFYLNSIFSQPVYAEGKPVGVVYRANFFSSYVNPLGFVLTEKWQWLAYLAIRFCAALLLTSLLLLLADRTGRTAGRNGGKGRQ